jgi:hypothetical protein
MGNALGNRHVILGENPDATMTARMYRVLVSKK